MNPRLPHDLEKTHSDAVCRVKRNSSRLTRSRFQFVRARGCAHRWLWLYEAFAIIRTDGKRQATAILSAVGEAGEYVEAGRFDLANLF